MSDQSIKSNDELFEEASHNFFEKAHRYGLATGEIALTEYVLTRFEDRLPSDLVYLLEKIKHQAYDVVADCIDLPAEDVALKVQNLVEETMQS